MKVAAIGLLCWLVTSAAVAQVVRQPKLGRLHLVVSDSFGVPTTRFHVTAFVDTSGHDWKRSFKGGDASGLPLGEYDLRIESDGLFLPYRDRVWLHDADSIHVVGLLFAGIENTPPFADLKGTVSGCGDNCWCKVVGVYTNFAMSVKTAPDDRFNFRMVPSGLYMLACFQDTTDVGSRVVRILAGSTPTVTFETKKPN